MDRVIFRFVRPDSIFGKLITWRLGEPWSHACIVIDDCAYSAQLPYIAMFPIENSQVSMPPRSGIDIHVDIDSADLEKLKEWCRSEIGITYDILAIFGWTLGWKWLQSRTNSYCFDFCYRSLVHIGWLEPTDDLVKGNRLMENIEDMMKKHITDNPNTSSQVVKVERYG